SETDVYTFGLGQYGQLGHGTFIFETSVPKSVKHLRRRKIHNVTCGENHTAVIAENGLMFTFGDGRHGKLGLGEENFANQFDPALCSNFLSFTVLLVACGGCHMLVFATPRPKESEEILLEDLSESRLITTISNMRGDSLVTNTLQLTSARMRRRERERSPEQFIRMARTLPPLGEHLKSSLRVSSNTSPLCFSATSLPKAEPMEERHHEKEKTNQKDEPGEDSAEDSDNGNNDRNLGDTTDILNMTHVMKLNSSDQSLILSPIQKQKEQNLSGDEETDDDDEEEEEAEEEAEEEEEEEEGDTTTEEEEDEDEEEGEAEKTDKEAMEEKYEKKENQTKTPEGEKRCNSTVEAVETEETTQKETIIQREKESADNHTVNDSSENTEDQTAEGIVGRKKFSLFKRKPPTSQKDVCNRKEDLSGKPLQSEQEKEKEDLCGEDSKDENQNHTLENSKETVTNQDRRDRDIHPLKMTKMCMHAIDIKKKNPRDHEDKSMPIHARAGK
ncbi:RPGR regulator, partial [Anseranas semipalmata]|nr:RPGR regulator [Anseranas semipalmata]